MQLTNDRGADLVVDTVGAATFGRALNASAYGGTVFTVGFLTGTKPQLDLLPIIIKALKVVGNNTGSVADLSEAVRAIDANRLIPVIDSTYSIDDVSQAYEHLASGGRHFGKIAIAH